MRKDTLTPPAPRRHIIKRPRLTRLLDETTARIILLVAPAGYGKTTLAREWLEDKPHIWYQARASSADPAALASGLISSAADNGFEVGRDVTSALKALTTLDPFALADLVVRDLKMVDTGVIIAIDDIHLIDSSPSDALVEGISERAPNQLVLTSRLRPAWASARRMLYGEVQELGRHALALSHDEGRRILRDRASEEVAGLMALSDGWPAVIGLAAHMRTLGAAPTDLPDALHEYFAEELYQAAEPAIQQALCQLSIPPRIAQDVLVHLFEDSAASVAEAGRDLGFLMPLADGALELHPLLRSFLARKLDDYDDAFVKMAARRCVEHFVARCEWDAAYSIIMAHKLLDVLPGLLLDATDELLQSGRIGTLSAWVSGAPGNEIGPELELVSSEVAFRRGAYLPAEASAKAAAVQFDGMHPWRSRAWFRAGQAAYFRDDIERALDYYSRARHTASRVADVKAALWGTFHAVVDADTRRAEDTLKMFTELDTTDRLDEVRYVNGRVALAIRVGPVEGALLDVESALGFLESIDDPVMRTSFLNSAAHVFLLVGQFRRALALATEELAEAQRVGLSFVLPHAIARKAMAEIGIGDFAAARSTLADHNGDFEDPYSRVLLAGVRIRLAIASGSPDDLDLISESVAAKVSAATFGEYLSSLALWHACNGNLEDGTTCLRRSTFASSFLEPRILSASAAAIMRLIGGRRSEHALARLVHLALASNCWEPVICAIRGHLPLAAALVETDHRMRRPFERIAEEAQDPRLGRALGIRVDFGVHSLTSREQEVHGLLAEGLTNREIARRLFITESTVKVHVRHVMEKLAADTRTAAALKFRQER